MRGSRAAAASDGCTRVPFRASWFTGSWGRQISPNVQTLDWHSLHFLLLWNFCFFGTLIFLKCLSKYRQIARSSQKSIIWIRSSVAAAGLFIDSFVVASGGPRKSSAGQSDRFWKSPISLGKSPLSMAFGLPVTLFNQPTADQRLPIDLANGSRTWKSTFSDFADLYSWLSTCEPVLSAHRLHTLCRLAVECCVGNPLNQPENFH